jgi:hypothetical protein
MNKEIQKHFKNNVTKTFIIYFFEIYFCYYLYILWMCLLYIYIHAHNLYKVKFFWKCKINMFICE